MHPERQFMQAAIEEAQRAHSADSYGIGAVVVASNGRLLSVEHTTTHETNDATAHAEVNAIRSACKKLNSRYLPGCWLYTTLEPCPMCSAAAIWAKMEGVVFGATKEDAMNFAKNLKKGKFTWRQINMSAREVLVKGDPKVQLTEAFMRDECFSLFHS
jgi:tRNA(Arg) A34 adenosine deaminase TadA